MKHVIKLMADYNCWPLWWADGEQVGDIDPHTLPLKAETVARLLRWAEQYDAGLNWADPAASAWPSRAAYEEFEREGFNLWLQLRDELRATHTVLFKSELLPQVLTDPREWPGL